MGWVLKWIFFDIRADFWLLLFKDFLKILPLKFQLDLKYFWEWFSLLDHAMERWLLNSLFAWTWLPLWRTMTKPNLFKDLIVFLPDIEGSLGTGDFHLAYFCIWPGLLLCNFKNQLNCFPDIFQGIFFCFTLTDSSGKFKILGCISAFIGFFEFIVNCMFDNWFFSYLNDITEIWVRRVSPFMFSAGVEPPVALMRHSAMHRTRTGLDCPYRPVSACTRVDSPFHPLWKSVRLFSHWKQDFQIRMTSLFRVHRISALRYRFCSRAKTLALHACACPRSRWWGDFPQQTCCRQPPFLSQPLVGL